MSFLLILLLLYIQIQSGNFDNYEHYGYMFTFCKNLISIDLSNFSFKKAKHIYGFFQNCINLEKIIWPNNKDNSLIESTAHMFQGCTKLTSIDLPFFDFSKVKLMYSSFLGCYNLEKIIFPSKNILFIEDIARMFFDCKIKFY